MNNDEETTIRIECKSAKEICENLLKKDNRLGLYTTRESSDTNEEDSTDHTINIKLDN